MKFKDELIKLGACEKAIEWVGDRTLKQAFNECERADWMMWYLRFKLGRRKVVGLSGRLANTTLHIYEKQYPEDDRVRKCIEATQDYEKGLIDENQLRNAAPYAYAPYASAAAAADRAASAAAYASADAAADRAAYAYASASAAAARASAAAARASAAAARASAAAADTKREHHKLMCDMIRKEIDVEDLVK